MKPEPRSEPTLGRIEVRGRGRVHSQPSLDGKYMSDVDDTDLENATVTISAGYDSSEDMLGFIDTASIAGSWDSVTGTFTLSDPLPYDLPTGSAYTLYDYGDKQDDITSVVVTVGGNSFVDASTTASVRAQGIAGGEGDDQLFNSGAVAVSASCSCTGADWVG